LRRRPVAHIRPARARDGAGLYLVGAYAVLAVLVAAVAVGLRGAIPWAHPAPRWSLAPGWAEATSVGLGLALAAVVVGFTRVAVRHFAWARTLADGLRPAVWSLSTPNIVAVALASSIAEELLFRAVLVPWLGVVVAAVAFGLAHQMRGPARWPWVAFSFAVGLALGALYAATGSLLGPIAAHAAINAANLAWLRSGRWSAAVAGRPVQRLSPT
jgi:membrane protease YdiL (CAAX protease family)